MMGMKPCFIRLKECGGERVRHLRQVDADRFKRLNPQPHKHFQAASLLCVPLVHAGRLLGVVQVVNKKEREEGGVVGGLLGLIQWGVGQDHSDESDAQGPGGEEDESARVLPTAFTRWDTELLEALAETCARLLHTMYAHEALAEDHAKAMYEELRLWQSLVLFQKLSPLVGSTGNTAVPVMEYSVRSASTAPTRSVFAVLMPCPDVRTPPLPQAYAPST
jgi:hypothetical protein